jgi:hypothetical protein
MSDNTIASSRDAIPACLQVELQLQDLQEQRLQQLAPSRLYLPVPWQPVVFEQPSTMYKVVDLST